MSVVTALFLGSALAACQNANTGSSSGETTLTVAVPSDITGVDPAFVIDDQTHELMYNVYDMGVGLGDTQTDAGLVRTTENLQPSAFESWDVSDDGLTYTIHVRKGMKFHDGSPVTAEDAVYSYDRLLGTQSGGTWALNNIAKITAKPKLVDDYTFELVADSPSVLTMPVQFNDTFAILNKKDIEKHATTEDPWAKDWLSKNISNGSGPYILKKHVKDQELEFEAFDDYWAGKPAYDKVIWKVIPSAAERLALLKAGSVDMAMGLTPQQIDSVKSTKGIKVSDAPTFRHTAMGLHNDMAPFDNKKVRQAVSYAIDYQKIIDDVYKGSMQRSSGPIPNGTKYALPLEDGYSYDLDKAKALLAESGYDGSEVTLSYNSAAGSLQDVAVHVQQDLKAIGMPVKLEPLNNAVFDERWNGKKLQMWLRDVMASIPDPNFIFDVFFKCDNFANYVNYCDKSADQAVATGWGMTDDAQRTTLFADVSKKVIEAAPWVWIGQANFQVAMRDTVDGYVTGQFLMTHYAELSPAK